MKKILLVLTLLTLVVGVQACSKEKSGEPAAKPDAPAAKPAEAPAKGDAAGTTAGQIGVPECDEYVSKIQKCVADKVPAAAQAVLKQSFEKNIDAWKAAAATPQGKAGLAMACKTAMNAAKTSMGTYGCEF